ncbi:MAG: phage integrase N-terminal SAM-like domain-containing protein, partial [Anaerolineae bacterium]|uniref:tyrosine-type recombinase/integrase n=1 Tax=Thermoflexus sp. TaxID=1969742 RepID=UPI0025F4062A
MSRPIQSSPVFLEALQAFLQDLRRAARSPRTIEGYERDLRDFAAWMEDRYGEPLDPRAVLPEDLADYRQHLLVVRRARPATVNRHIAALRAFFKFLATRRKIPSNPADRLPRVREARRAPRALSETELRRLLREARRASNPLHRAVIFLLAHTGLRASELCDLRLGDLVVVERQGKPLPRAIRVRGKGEKVRTVPLNAPAREVLL